MAFLKIRTPPLTWFPEIILVLETALCHVSTVAWNPISITLIILLIVLYKRQHATAGMFTACVFLIANFYMSLAWISELPEVAQPFEDVSAVMTATGMILLTGLAASFGMLLKWMDRFYSTNETPV